MTRIPIVGLILLCGIAGIVPAHTDSSADHVYLIMPFENVAEDPSLDWLSTGLALSLGEYLRGAGVQVIDDEMRAALLEAHGIPPGADLTLASVLQLGRTMRTRPAGPHPDHTLVGTFTISDGELSLRARWIHLQREYAGPWIEEKGRLRDLLEIHARLARDLVKEIDPPRSRDDGQPSGAGAFGDPPLLAFETYCRGMAETDLKQRLKLLRQAVNEYPGYHRAAYQAAALLAKTDRWNDAAIMLDKAADDPRPYRYEYFMLKALIALEQHRPDAAAQAAIDAFEARETAEAQIFLCRARIAGGQYDAARAALDQAEAIHPDHPELGELRTALAAAGTGGSSR